MARPTASGAVSRIISGRSRDACPQLMELLAAARAGTPSSCSRSPPPPAAQQLPPASPPHAILMTALAGGSRVVPVQPGIAPLGEIVVKGAPVAAASFRMALRATLWAVILVRT